MPGAVGSVTDVKSGPAGCVPAHAMCGPQWLHHKHLGRKQIQGVRLGRYSGCEPAVDVSV
ncbi:hypothetical protein D2E29_01235 [Mycobacteroides abscessus]|nr:hypothetical protein DDT48_05875 [Mycobacteroides abscessus]PVA25556.1 hypothetical protein DDJ46_01245 [Mycobacteroides abscessus]PVA55447.1 hypothetical protein DDJ73_01245 [Mycobacteroides abscessus]PVB50058.1 hypothetical protein DDK07_01570 [Mycobacteroides abscessus]RIQ84770.1 hypothetical protein D2E32_13280 [Mycobacteroides abscessus]